MTLHMIKLLRELEQTISTSHTTPPLSSLLWGQLTSVKHMKSSAHFHLKSVLMALVEMSVSSTKTGAGCNGEPSKHETLTS